ncbi:hypothetical protein [Streptomyces fulvorobeus]|uniref:Uncharacterized protein n=1 Tax=Streptomyces fulvorobeus TaxID=284028 RepID=A0A7Y9KUC9_9ACTN|nr:hypothetical protein [Streptomyces fulvorobeus]NYE41996.1 hypothetical protein [Streptomyces fulvorobeus]
MAVVPCRHNDGGLCTEPDSVVSAGATVLVKQGNLSLLSQPLAALLFPEGIQLKTDRFATEIKMPREVFMAEVFESIFSPEESSLQRELVRAIGTGDGVIVHCDCDHIYLYGI